MDAERQKEQVAERVLPATWLYVCSDCHGTAQDEAEFDDAGWWCSDDRSRHGAIRRVDILALPDLLAYLRTQASHEAELVSLTRGQDEESIAISSMHAGRCQAYNTVANCLEAYVRGEQ